MKAKIHPTYYNQAKIKCNCGATYEIGSTRAKINVEVCANCHPFYTGKQNLIDTAGRVEKFEARRKKSQELQIKHAEVVKKRASRKPKLKIEDDSREKIKKMKQSLEKGAK